MLLFRLFSIGAETWKVLAVFEDLVDHFALEFLHVLVLELLDGVAAHDLVSHLVFVLADHQACVLEVAVALVGDLVVPL